MLPHIYITSGHICKKSCKYDRLFALKIYQISLKATAFQLNLVSVYAQNNADIHG